MCVMLLAGSMQLSLLMLVLLLLDCRCCCCRTVVAVDAATVAAAAGVAAIVAAVLLLWLLLLSMLSCCWPCWCFCRGVCWKLGLACWILSSDPVSAPSLAYPFVSSRTAVRQLLLDCHWLCCCSARHRESSPSVCTVVSAAHRSLPLQSGATGLVLAASSGHLPVVQFLIECKANIDVQTEVSP